MTDPAAPAARPLRGVLLVVFATLAFAAADTITKDQAARHPVALVVAVRYLVNLALIAAVMGPRLGSGLWRVRRRGLVFLRALCLALASLTMGHALRLMPVGETVAIIYLAPLVVLLLSGPLLGERVGLVAWLAALGGFAGVLLIMRPGSGLDPLGVVFALLNVVCGAAYHLLTRLLARSEGTAPLLWHTAAVGTVFFGLGALWAAPDVSAGWADLGWMVALGALAALGHFLFTAAYREAPAGLLAPVNYLHLVWAGLLGLVVFAHLPDGWALVGMAVVALAGAGAALAARR